MISGINPAATGFGAYKTETGKKQPVSFDTQKKGYNTVDLQSGTITKDGSASQPALKFDTASFDREAFEKARDQKIRESAEMLNASIEHTFNEGTLANHIHQSLKGKIDDADGVADRLNDMIRATFGSGATVEERAEQRETGLLHAEYLAETYFENPDEAKAFLDEIYRFANNDVLREKGYRLLDDWDGVPIRPYEDATTPDRRISHEAYARHAGYGSLREVMADPETTKAFYGELEKKQGAWSKEIKEAFEASEARIDEIIAMVRGNLSEDKIAGSLNWLLGLQ